MKLSGDPALFERPAHLRAGVTTHEPSGGPIVVVREEMYDFYETPVGLMRVTYVEEADGRCGYAQERVGRAGLSNADRRFLAERARLKALQSRSASARSTPRHVRARSSRPRPARASTPASSSSDSDPAEGDGDLPPPVPHVAPLTPKQLALADDLGRLLADLALDGRHPRGGGR